MFLDHIQRRSTVGSEVVNKECVKNPRSLAEYTGRLIQASKALNSTDEATCVVTTGGLNLIRPEGFILICCVLLFECVFF